MKEIARRFGTLLREIVETIDMHGLKARYLGKHRKSAAGFIEHVVAMKCATEAALALKKRIEKNRCSHSSTAMACLGPTTMPSMPCAPLRVCGTESPYRPRFPGLSRLGRLHRA